jgi:hypothetical protein
MIDPELLQRIDAIEAKIDENLRITRGLRSYNRITMVVTFIFIVLPLILSVVAIPYLLDTLSQLYVL